MDLIDIDNNSVDVNISFDELLVISNSLNEVCNGLDQFDFDIRMGVSNADVQALLSKVGSIIDALEKSKV